MLDQLEKLAKAATPGPWECKDSPEAPFDGEFRVLGPYNVKPPEHFDDRAWCGYFGKFENAQFVAAANPETVLKLIAVARVAIHCVSYNRDCYKGPLANELRRLGMLLEDLND